MSETVDARRRRGGWELTVTVVAIGDSGYGDVDVDINRDLDVAGIKSRSVAGVESDDVAGVNDHRGGHN